jgi:hypothetical protein
MPPNTDLIEALDSMSASFILRAGKASSTERSDAVAKWRQTLMSRHRRFGGRSCGGNGSQKIRRRVTIVPATTQVVSAHTSPNKHKKDTYEMRSSSPAAIGRQVRKNKRVSLSRPAKCTAHVVAQQAAPRAAILTAAGYSFSTGYVQASATTVQLYSCTTVPYSYIFSDAKRQSDTAAAVGQYHHAWTGTEWDR